MKIDFKTLNTNKFILERDDIAFSKILITIFEHNMFRGLSLNEYYLLSLTVTVLSNFLRMLNYPN